MKRTLLGALGTTVLGAALASLPSCSDTGSETTAAPTAANPNTITLGMVLSLSGPLAGGPDAKQGAEVAVAQINALGGILGKTVVLREVDDQSDPNIARAELQKMIGEGVTLAIGPSTNASAEAIKDLLVANQLLVLSPSATSTVLDNLTDAGVTQIAAQNVVPGTTPVLLRTAATDVFLATALAQYGSEIVTTPEGLAPRCRNIAIVYQNDDYGRPIEALLAQRYRALDFGVRKEITLDPADLSNAKLDSAASQSAGELGANCQVVIAQPKVAGAYMRAYDRYRLLNPQKRDYAAFATIGGDGLRDAAFIQAARTNEADTTSVSAGENAFTIAADTAPESEFSTQQFSAFSNLYQAQFPGADVGRYASTAYDAVVLLAGAIQRAQSTTDIPLIRQTLYRISQGRRIVGPNVMSEYLQLVQRGDDINYEGASGSCDFLSTGTVRSGFAVWQIVNSAYERRATIPADILSAQATF